MLHSWAPAEADHRAAVLHQATEKHRVTNNTLRMLLCSFERCNHDHTVENWETTRQSLRRWVNLSATSGTTLTWAGVGSKGCGHLAVTFLRLSSPNDRLLLENTVQKVL
jgi:hypothetical protein